jgi:hypothetical protein
MAARSGKVNLAKEQLEDGIDLFLRERYVSALTLLGSSEEILSRLVEEATGAHPLESTWTRANEMRSLLGKPHISKQEIFKAYNTGRNTVKHHTPGESKYVAHYRFGEAFMMIQRATASAELLKLRYRGKKEYKAWLVQIGFAAEVPKVSRA